MGKPDITEAVAFLTEGNVRAARGYPDAPVPQLKAVAVAVNVHKEEPEAVTYAAVIYSLRSIGGAGCETAARWVASLWSAKGAACSWGGCQYDEIVDAYTVTVYGRWEVTAQTAEE